MKQIGVIYFLWISSNIALETSGSNTLNILITCTEIKLQYFPADDINSPTLLTTFRQS